MRGFLVTQRRQPGGEEGEIEAVGPSGCLLLAPTLLNSHPKSSQQSKTHTEQKKKESIHISIDLIV